MQRIAHVISTPQGFGGAEQVLQVLVEAADDRGWTQIILNPFSRRLGDGLSDRVPLVEERTCNHLWQLPGLRHWLRRRLTAFQPDVLHVHLFHAQVAIASIPRLGLERRLLTHHHGDMFVHEGHAYERFLDEVSGRRYDRVIAVSESVRGFLVDRYGYPPELVGRIRNGWVNRAISPAKRTGPPSVVCIANFRQQKGHQSLISAMKRVVARIPEARLLLVGSGDLFSEIERQVAEVGLSRVVEFVGSVTDVAPYLASADVLVLPSIYEPLGIVLMEAMGAGLPVVATEVGGIPEVVVPGETGLLVPPADPRALSEALIELLENPSLRESMGKAAVAKAEAFRMDRMIDAYFLEYHHLLSSRVT